MHSNPTARAHYHKHKERYAMKTSKILDEDTLNKIQITVIPESELYKHRMRENAILLIDSYLKKHNKAFLVRVTITYPQDYQEQPQPAHISRFAAKMIQYFSRKGYDPRYMWAREIASSPHHHYHFAIILNGNHIQHPAKVTSKAQELWGTTIRYDAKGLVNYDNSNMIRRDNFNFRESYIKSLTMLRYLTKALSKGQTNDGLRDFGISRL